MTVKLQLPIGLCNYLHYKFGPQLIAEDNNWLLNKVLVLINYENEGYEGKKHKEYRWTTISINEKELINPPNVVPNTIYLTEFGNNILYTEIYKLFCSDLFSYIDSYKRQKENKSKPFSFAKSINIFSNKRGLYLDKIIRQRARATYQLHLKSNSTDLNKKTPEKHPGVLNYKRETYL